MPLLFANDFVLFVVTFEGYLGRVPPFDRIGDQQTPELIYEDRPMIMPSVGTDGNFLEAPGDIKLCLLHFCHVAGDGCAKAADELLDVLRLTRVQRGRSMGLNVILRD